MIARAVLSAFALLCFTNTGAQLIFSHGDIRSQGMAGIQSIHSDHWSGMVNPASLAGIKQSSFGFSYTNLYQVAELGLGSSFIILPTKTGNFGAGYMSFGYSALRQSMATISFGKNLGNKIKAGVGLNYLNISQPRGYTDLYAFIPSIGLQLHLFKNFILGACLFNPGGQEFVPSGYKSIPVTIITGLGCSMGEEVLLCLEMKQSSNEKGIYAAGFEIMIQHALRLRFGVSSELINRFSLGTSFYYRHFNLGLAVVHHPVLGMGSAIGLTYTFK